MSPFQNGRYSRFRLRPGPGPARSWLHSIFPPQEPGLEDNQNMSRSPQYCQAVRAVHPGCSSSVLHPVIPVPVEQAAALIKCPDQLHVIFLQGKIKDIEIFFHAFPVSGFGNDHDAVLKLIPQSNLSGSAAVPAGDVIQQRVGKDRFPAFGEGCPGLARAIAERFSVYVTKIIRNI